MATKTGTSSNPEPYVELLAEARAIGDNLSKAEKAKTVFINKAITTNCFNEARLHGTLEEAIPDLSRGVRNEIINAILKMEAAFDTAKARDNFVKDNLLKKGATIKSFMVELRKVTGTGNTRTSKTNEERFWTRLVSGLRQAIRMPELLGCQTKEEVVDKWEQGLGNKAMNEAYNQELENDNIKKQREEAKAKYNA